MRESVLVRKIRYVKPNEMLSFVGTSRENPNKDSEAAKHLFQHPEHVFQWKVLMSAPMNSRKRKNLETFFRAVKHPTLNGQKDSKLTLFRNGDLIYNDLLTASSYFFLWGKREGGVVFWILQLCG